MSLIHCYTKEDEELEEMLNKSEPRTFPHPKNVFSVSRHTTLDLSKTTHRFKKTKKQNYDPCMIHQRGGTL